MTEQLSINLAPEVVYVSGTVNGEAASFSLTSPNVWSAIVPKSPDGKYIVQIVAYNSLGAETIYNTIIYRLDDLIDLKSDWTSEDYYNFDDLNKVEANMQYISDYLGEIGYIIPLVNVTTNRDMTSIDYVSSINRIEESLEMIAKKINTVKPPGYKPKKTWTNKMGFSYQDANRYALNLKLLYKWATYIKEGFKYCGEVYCGEEVI